MNFFRTLTLIFVLLIIAIGYTKHKNQSKIVASTSPVTTPTTVSTKSAAISAPKEEPSEEVLRKLEFQAYDELEKAGGLAMTIQTSEQQATPVPMKIKLYEVHKDKCTPSPLGDGTWYECNLTIKLGFNGGTPGVQGGRIGVKWNSTKGEWVNQASQAN